MKKFFAVLLIALLVTGGAVFAQAEQEKEDVVIRLAYGSNPRDVNGQVVEKFKELAQEYSDGRITVQTFEDNQLGDEQECIRNLGDGTLDMTAVYTGNMTPFSPSVGILIMPYMLTTNEEAMEATETLLPLLNEKAVEESNTRILGVFTKGFRAFTNSVKPIKTLDDLRSIKLRVSSIEVVIETFKTWGVDPVPMSWGEVFTGLQQGVIDGQENPHVTNLAMGFYDVQDYITDNHYMLWTGPLLISETTYQNLPDDLKDVVERAGLEACEYGSLKQEEMNEEALDELIEKGMEYNGVIENEDHMMELARGVWLDFADDVGGEEWLREATEEIGIDVDDY